MLNVNIITVGKLKEAYLRDACAEYTKRLGGFCKLNITELPESKLSDSPSEKEIQNALSIEGKAIAAMLSEKNSYNISMCIEGKQMPSEKLAETVGRISVEGKSRLNFVIGSSFGISEEVKKLADLRLSMSEMTFPHQLARVMLLEQLYRSFQILNGGKYHK
ncbi:MAG: 23S rRNA (pseudouridine(1915)-N(3))-methyltransferase RlmH [Oscillospiraceae bacterium]|nr:23S rRNA (pseudouridine(1915)-N(3))-methyltransferase RlmH [Oscillospiraceae bacterium]